MAPKHDILYVNFYTDGSAAKKLAPAFPAAQPRKKPVAKRKKKTVIYFDPVALCSLVVAAVLLIMMVVGLNHLQNAQAEALAMEQYLEQLTEENNTLRQEFDSQVDLETVEKTALAMGMVPQDQVETVIIRVDPTPVQQVSSPTIWERMYAILTNLFA